MRTARHLPQRRRAAEDAQRHFGVNASIRSNSKMNFNWSRLLRARRLDLRAFSATQRLCGKYLGALAILLVPGVAHSQTLQVRVENKLPIARDAETVALPWAQITQQLPRATASLIRVMESVSQRELTTQALDHNADGQIDSLLFQTSLQPNEIKVYAIEAATPTAKPVARVHVKFVPEREDVAWESDRIAFRTYGKKLWELENLHTNGIDVWPKRTRELVLDRWYAKGHDGYHVDVGEGADFYQVGTTLGTGGTGIWKNDQLFRGDNFLEHKIIADGPIRLIYELRYGTVDAGGTKVTERKRVSMDAGQYFFKQQSTFTSSDDKELHIAIGLVKRPGMIGSSLKDRDWAWVTGWGPIEPRTKGHGDLGTAAFMHKSQLFDTREISNHYLVIGRVQPGQTLTSYVGAGWTSSRDFDSAEDWWKQVDGFAQRLGSPLIVSVVAR
jgi:pectinesterase